MLVNDDYIIYDGIGNYCEVTMNNEEWQRKVKGILKAELKRRDVSYKDLVEKLAAIGIEESEKNIANKLARGSFTAVFFVQCLMAIGCEILRLEDI